MFPKLILLTQKQTQLVHTYLINIQKPSISFSFILISSLTSTKYTCNHVHLQKKLSEITFQITSIQNTSLFYYRTTCTSSDSNKSHHWSIRLSFLIMIKGVVFRHFLNTPATKKNPCRNFSFEMFCYVFILYSYAVTKKIWWKKKQTKGNKWTISDWKGFSHSSIFLSRLLQWKWHVKKESKRNNKIILWAKIYICGKKRIWTLWAQIDKPWMASSFWRPGNWKKIFSLPS